ncbi:Hypothetical protein, putative DHH phosphoesterase [Anopheles sinensis]|uniref:Uncharacterized protein n=1 Tax=Anopheles sinensis TaxID=74873 RepID=A0A084VWJ5_ANOSI|nr:Hypothetical protein, putative DHH phosphoesterase [Anopheles sinensis]
MYRTSPNPPAVGVLPGLNYGPDANRCATCTAHYGLQQTDRRSGKQVVKRPSPTQPPTFGEMLMD